MEEAMHKLLIGVVPASILMFAPVESAMALTGSYSRTCNRCATEGNTLSCTCRRINGQYIYTRMEDYTKCPNQSVENIDGHLRCAPAPSHTCASCNDGSCQCGAATKDSLCAGHRGNNPKLGCARQQVGR